jgi:hypothetical protein
MLAGGKVIALESLTDAVQYEYSIRNSVVYVCGRFES